MGGAGVTGGQGPAGHRERERLGPDHPEGGVMSRLGNIGGRLYRGEVSFDFVGRQKLWYKISGAILVVSIAALLIFGLKFSVDFKGGSVYKFKAPAATSTQVSNTVTKAGGCSTLTAHQVAGK